ncbi:helix-turn-helix domain-containing protein [Enterococcus thailandicus]|uniref:helix-turn-helix domain-containing protein n=1 Tax=Enterococcus thailandicus TaxID=417368 RepID=UPI00288D5935|nr:helix-turn-helix domain-containing protein [Enterococcus thailandicus]MDT2776624.1 helix-turn-helix domain-containing protein [Enterococcus thailandicus]
MKTLLKQKELHSLMKREGDDPYSLAKRMGVAPSTVYRILNGDRGVGGELIPKLLKAFNLSEEDFDKLFIFSEVLPKSNEEVVK